MPKGAKNVKDVDGAAHAARHDADISRKAHHATNGIVMEGWLQKEGHGKKASTFQKRWVVIQEDELRYYKVRKAPACL
jgi:hypothetical protein